MNEMGQDIAINNNNLLRSPHVVLMNFYVSFSTTMINHTSLLHALLM
jgi:hypothetical protein